MNTHRQSQKCAQCLLRWRLPLLALGLVAAVLAYPLADRLEFDQTLQNMFAPDDPELAAFEKFGRTFGGDQVVLAVYDEPNLMTPAGIASTPSRSPRM